MRFWCFVIGWLNGEGEDSGDGGCLCGDGGRRMMKDEVRMNFFFILERTF